MKDYEPDMTEYREQLTEMSDEDVLTEVVCAAKSRASYMLGSASWKYEVETYKAAKAEALSRMAR